MPAPILVIGATGTIGHHVVAALDAREQPIRAFVRSPERAAALSARYFTITQGDLTDPASIDVAMEGVEQVFLVTSPSPAQVLLEGNAIEAAQRAGVRHVVKVSAYGAGASGIHLAEWHGSTEAQLKASGLDYTLLRPHSFMQNLFMHLPTIHDHGAFYGAQGDAAIPQIDARDIAEVAAVALTEDGHAGKTYTLTGPERITNAEVAALLSEVLEKPVHYVDMPPAAMRQGLIDQGFPEWLAADLSTLAEVYQHADQPVSPEVETILGRPGYTMAAFLRDHAAVLRG